MPNTTDIEYQRKGFSTAEIFMEILSYYICQTFESTGLHQFNENLLKIYNNCDGNRSGSSIGMVNILFDKYITNHEDELTMIQILEQTKKNIQQKGNTISIEELNAFESQKEFDEFKISWDTPIQTKNFIKLLDIMIRMLKGTYPTNNHYIMFEL